MNSMLKKNAVNFEILIDPHEIAVSSFAQKLISSYISDVH